MSRRAGPTPSAQLQDDQQSQKMEDARVALLVPRSLVKSVKSALEERDLLDRTIKIKAESTSTSDRDNQDAMSEPRMLIPTKIPSRSESLEQNDRASNEVDFQITASLPDLGLEPFTAKIEIATYLPKSPNTQYTEGRYLNALRAGLEKLPQKVLELLDLSVDALVSSFPESYSIYKPMLLLPHNSITSTLWQRLFSTHSPTSQVLRPIWKNLATATQTTHVAINAGIPPSTGASKNDTETHKEEPGTQNVLRSPVNLIPIYGDFGPPPTPTSLLNPTASDFSSAFWVSQTQNGIHQTWAPLYTMFSRGNIREKTRLLTLPSVINSVQEEKGCTAVDLYAGIGYFAFSYRKAGVKKVLCWELNPWSVEGLRRGAERNGWTTQIFTDIPDTQEGLLEWSKDVKNVDFLVFQQSNEHTLRAIATLVPDFCGSPPVAASLPPIRHVNCGLLPSSQHSWRNAVAMMDRDLGGWIHVHENVGVTDIDTKREEVVSVIQSHLDRWEGERGYCGFQRRRVKCEHVEKVKTYAPGVLHVVFDIWVDGMRDAEEVC